MSKELDFSLYRLFPHFLLKNFSHLKYRTNLIRFHEHFVTKTWVEEKGVKVWAKKVKSKARVWCSVSLFTKSNNTDCCFFFFCGVVSERITSKDCTADAENFQLISCIVYQCKYRRALIFNSTYYNLEIHNIYQRVCITAKENW